MEISNDEREVMDSFINDDRIPMSIRDKYKESARRKEMKTPAEAAKAAKQIARRLWVRLRPLSYYEENGGASPSQRYGSITQEEAKAIDTPSNDIAKRTAKRLADMWFWTWSASSVSPQNASPSSATTRYAEQKSDGSAWSVLSDARKGRESGVMSSAKWVVEGIKEGGKGLYGSLSKAFQWDISGAMYESSRGLKGAGEAIGSAIWAPIAWAAWAILNPIARRNKSLAKNVSDVVSIPAWLRSNLKSGTEEKWFARWLMNATEWLVRWLPGAVSAVRNVGRATGAATTASKWLSYGEDLERAILRRTALNLGKQWSTQSVEALKDALKSGSITWKGGYKWLANEVTAAKNAIIKRRDAKVAELKKKWLDIVNVNKKIPDGRIEVNARDVLRDAVKNISDTLDKTLTADKKVFVELNKLKDRIVSGKMDVASIEKLRKMHNEVIRKSNANKNAYSSISARFEPTNDLLIRVIDDVIHPSIREETREIGKYINLENDIYSARNKAKNTTIDKRSGWSGRADVMAKPIVGAWRSVFPAGINPKNLGKVADASGGSLLDANKSLESFVSELKTVWSSKAQRAATAIAKTVGPKSVPARLSAFTTGNLTPERKKKIEAEIRDAKNKIEARKKAGGK